MSGPTTLTHPPLRTAADIVHQIDSVATLPEVMTRINAIINDPNSTAADLEEILQMDPALVARVMKLANSAFYARSQPIATVNRAINMLGFKTIHSLAMAAGIGTLFQRVQLGDGLSAKHLWHHSVAVGVISRDLAKKLRIPWTEEAFLAGIVHDLGLLAGLQVAPEPFARVCRESSRDSRPFCEQERELIGFDHQQIGLALTKKWNFPVSCQIAASLHHDPQQATESDRLLATIIYLADTLCCLEKIGFDRTARHQELNRAVVRNCGIDQTLIEETRTELAALAWGAITILG